MVSFQSRIYIYRTNFFYLLFFIKLLFSKLYKIESDTINLKKKLIKKFNVKNVHLVGQCREGIYYTVKYSILKTNKKEVIVSSCINSLVS